MKRIVWVLFLICVLLFSAACCNENPTSTDDTTNPTTSTETGEIELKIHYDVLRPEKSIQSLSFAQFLSDVNWNGEYLPNTEIVAPGSLRNPSLIPSAPQDWVGKTAEVAFHHDTSYIYFYYNANEELQQERLAVIVEAKIPLLVVLETDLGGADQLRNKLANAEPFQVKVLALANMDNTEPIYVSNACNASLDERTYIASEFVDIYGKAPTYGIFMGKVIFHTSQNPENIVYLRGCAASSASKELKSRLSVFERSFVRYGFMDEMLLADD